MVNFVDIVTSKTGGCAKCFNITYTLPYLIDADLANYLTGFGHPAYPLATVRLLRINAPNGFHIEGRIGTKSIKFVMPKKYEKVPLDQIQEKKDFEKALATWLSQKLNMAVDI